MRFYFSHNDSARPVFLLTITALVPVKEWGILFSFWGHRRELLGGSRALLFDDK